MLEKLKEFKETLSERIRSPFVGSFMITWSIIHWKIFVLFFYEEKGLPIQDRIQAIEGYLKNQKFCDLIGYPVLITFVVLLAYSLLNGLGLVIKLLYDQWISPYIQKVLYNKNIIEKPIYEKLKREYDSQKKDYDLDKEIYVKSQTENRELKEGLESRMINSFDAKRIDDITHLLTTNQVWEVLYEYPDGTTRRESFMVDRNDFVVTNGDIIKIENIKASPDGKILSFNKIIGEKVTSSYLIRDERREYYGVEDNKISVTYRKKREEITIISAKYGAGEFFYDVTEKVSNLVSKNMEIKSSNELAGDPNRGARKHLEIVYKINNIGEEKGLSIPEGESRKIIE